MHNRFNREVYAFPDDFTGALAKWLVKQSPYPVPDNLPVCIEKFHLAVIEAFNFDTGGMAKIELGGLTSQVNELLESIPEIAALNEPKTGHNEHIFVSRYHDGPSNPDDDFIDIMAVAQNITCEFADREDAQAYLDASKDS